MTMKWERDDSLKSELSRVRGLGASGSGAETWLNERISAIASLPLVFWLIWAVVRMPSWDYSTFVYWLATPINAILMILSVISIFWHAALGSRVIVEDYIHNEAFKFVKLIGIKLFFTAAAIACVFSILKIAFWA